MVVTQVPGQRAAAQDQRGASEARLEWWRGAACQEADPELFFPVAAQGPARDEIARAKAVCAGCRVRRQCLQFALATSQMHGVWGGTTEDERLPHVRRERELRERAGTVRVTTVY
jgi:WhiB family transcriptional regulator, redox-sensing transcriptional regulator